MVFWYVDKVLYDAIDRAESYMLPVFFESRAEAHAYVLSAVQDIETARASDYEYTFSIWSVEPSVSRFPFLESLQQVVPD